MPIAIAHHQQQLQHGVCHIEESKRHLMVGRGLRAVLFEDGFYRSHNVDALFGSLARHAGA
jgi:hypothetical protein